MLFEMQTLGDLTPAGVSALADIGKMTYQLAGAPFAEEDNSTFFYQSDKEGRYEAGDSKGVVHFWRMFPYLRSVYTFEHPYDAAASYEYGRNIKAR
jgi:hypothetical protein